MRPLTHGSVLIVGAKASNFDSSVRENPRITWWDSQDERWSGKSIPENIQAVFFTKWVGHTDFGNIMKDVRKRRITVFQPQGTGMIAKQVKELLTVPSPIVSEPPTITHYTVTLPETKTMHPLSKLHPLAPFIDDNLSAYKNADILLAKAQELGIPTTRDSLAVFVSRVRRAKAGVTTVRARRSRNAVIEAKSTPLPKYEQVDAAVEIFDSLLKELTDMRQFLVSTVEENTKLKARIATFKKALDA